MMTLHRLLRSVPLPLVKLKAPGCDLDPDIVRVVEDSRMVRPGDLFVARAGTHNNGQRFIADAIQRGATAIVTDRSALLPTSSTIPVVQCDNPALALGWLAQAIHDFPARAMKLLAVTGTNGKTTTTYLIRSVMRQAGIISGLIGTVQLDDGKTVLDSPMTTPGPVELADILARMKDNGVRAVALEASSHALSQGRLAGLDIQVAMFSNLTGDHLDYHGTMENYAAAKALLFESLAPDAYAVINAQDAWSSRMIRDCGAKTISYGIDCPADFSCAIHSMTAAGMDLSIRGPDGAVWNFWTGLVGRHNVQNILCAAAACWAVGVAPEYIVAGMKAGDSVPGRLQPVVPVGTTRQEMLFAVLVDYAHTHDALENVLKALRGISRGKLICVFGCGGDRDATKRPKMGAVAERLADTIIVTDDNPRTEASSVIIEQIRHGFSGDMGDRLAVIPDRAAAIRHAINIAQQGDVVLIAGKGHENYQIIGTSRHPFDDVEQAKAALMSRLGLITNGKA